MFLEAQHVKSLTHSLLLSLPLPLSLSFTHYRFVVLVHHPRARKNSKTSLLFSHTRSTLCFLHLLTLFFLLINYPSYLSLAPLRHSYNPRVIFTYIDFTATLLFFCNYTRKKKKRLVTHSHRHTHTHATPVVSQSNLSQLAIREKISAT